MQRSAELVILTAAAQVQDMTQALSSLHCNVLVTSQQDPCLASRVLAEVKSMLPKKLLQPGAVPTLLIAGLPNTGKTTLLNSMKQHAVKTGALKAGRAGKHLTGPVPGVTKHVSGFKVSRSHASAMTSTCI
jgi:ribosome biogenesis GTPase A